MSQEIQEEIDKAAADGGGLVNIPPNTGGMSDSEARVARDEPVDERSEEDRQIKDERNGEEGPAATGQTTSAERRAENYEAGRGEYEDE